MSGGTRTHSLFDVLPFGFAAELWRKCSRGVEVKSSLLICLNVAVSIRKGPI